MDSSREEYRLEDEIEPWRQPFDQQSVDFRSMDDLDSYADTPPISANSPVNTPGQVIHFF